MKRRHITRVLQGQTIPDNHTVVQLLAVEKDPLPHDTSVFLYAFVVVVEVEAETDESDG